MFWRKWNSIVMKSIFLIIPVVRSISLRVESMEVSRGWETLNSNSDSSYFSYYGFHLSILCVCRIRIVEEKFVDTTPSRPDTGEAGPSEVPDAEKKAPYSLIVSS